MYTRTHKKKIFSGVLAGAVLLIPVGSVSAQNNTAVDTYSLDEVLVTANRYETKDVNIPAATEVFTKEKIEAMGAKSVMEVLQNIPGFVISESPSGNGSPGLRGISGHLSILINGIPLASETYFQMGTLSTAGIERIEVVKGGSAVLYGSNATTGVINIITQKNGKNKVAVSAGDHKQKEFSGVFNSEGLSVSYDRYDIRKAGLVYDSSTQYYRDFLRRDSVNVNYAPNEHWNFMYLYSDKDSNCNRVVKATGKPTTDWRNNTLYHVFQTTYTNHDFRTVVYYQNREWFSNLGGSVSIQRGGYYGVDVQNKWKLKGTEVSAGGTVEREDAKHQSSNKWMYNQRNHGALFFLTDTPVSNQTNIIFGAREVFTGNSGNVLCPQLQVLHKLNGGESLYVNINKSLREPDLTQRYGYGSGQEPNPDLKSENAWTYEAGWKKMFSSHSVLKFDLYHMEIKDRIYSVRLRNGNTTYRNALKYRNTGAELSYEWNAPKGFSFGFGMSYSNPEQITTTTGSWEKAENRLGLHSEIMYTTGKTSVNLFANYAGQRVNDTSSMILLDMTIKERMTEQDSLSLKIGNILNRTDYRSSTGGSVVPERNFLLTYERAF